MSGRLARHRILVANLAARPNGLPYMARNRRSGCSAAVVLTAVVLLVAYACSSRGGSGGGPSDAAATTSTPTAPFDVAPLLHPAGRMLGVVDDKSPWQYDIVKAFGTQAGRAPDIREYYDSWGDDFDAEGNTFLWQHGQLPMLSLVPSDTALADIGGGYDDAYVRKLARQVASYHGPLVLSFAGEMNGPWNSWGPGHAKAADFVTAWKHVHDVFRELKVTNVIWTWSPHVVDSGTKAKLRPYYPGDAYVDWVGLIGYYGPIDGAAFSSLFTPTLKEISRFSDKPVLITETGVAESSRKEQQVRDLFKGAAKAGVIGLVWYDQRKDWPGSTQMMDWRIDTSLGSQAAFRAESQRYGFGHPFGKS
ncbi:glycoside hydrolase family 26 protein [Actinacidiphila bryophytorum]|uniref:Beta-mannanase n=1 Tax=Actinacidiphila bryophytorum TaxID=1436133 RepID=A0A9W4GXM8_9ACTN|nr:glycosyl hydrolase [Actinacidiphila bryophytorum]MBM9435282.1 beta-mannanase [Actinacidiphila bryophytorum]MBN6546963.1 beta-mannanase [Actinacidiphila bryophytorum]CAG7606358.1 Beta-mannanase [Actinacidiphila bryophytorum]